jgi:UDP-2,4-diacetamido-2,4,6-trideoxy-beta-L-altropyranose hydrolase
MRVAFRVDARSEIGTGHFTRSLALADELAMRGAEVVFVSRGLPAHLAAVLRERGAALVPLESKENGRHDSLPRSKWLGATQADDAEETITRLGGPCDWLVVDHYGVGAPWEERVRRIASRIAAIDDLADRSHQCDLLLDQNYYRRGEAPYADLVPPNCERLIGPRFALLRKEFAQRRHALVRSWSDVKRVLVFFGGIDAANYTSLAVAALARIPRRTFEVDVVIGEAHPRRAQIVSLCADLAFECHVQTNHMAALIAGADLGVGAGGSASWERCCLGLPTITFAVADNQRNLVEEAAADGLLYAPDSSGGEDVGGQIERHVEALLSNARLRAAIGSSGMRAVDGDGVDRVVARMGCLEVHLRRATEQDGRALHDWRNDPEVRAMSRDRKVISWEQHSAWLARTLADPAKALLIGSKNGVPVGVVRFDMQGNQAEISIYVVPDAKQRGLGRQLLAAAERYCDGNLRAIVQIRAEVLGTNDVSRRLFEGAGFHLDGTKYAKELR